MVESEEKLKNLSMKMKESGKSVLILSFLFCVLTSSSYKNISQIGLGYTLITSFYLNHPFEAHVSKHSQF